MRVGESCVGEAHSRPRDEAVPRPWGRICLARSVWRELWGCYEVPSIQVAINSSYNYDSHSTDVCNLIDVNRCIVTWPIRPTSVPYPQKEYFITALQTSTCDPSMHPISTPSFSPSVGSSGHCPAK